MRKVTGTAKILTAPPRFVPMWMKVEPKHRHRLVADAVTHNLIVDFHAPPGILVTLRGLEPDIISYRGPVEALIQTWGWQNEEARKLVGLEADFD